VTRLIDVERTASLLLHGPIFPIAIATVAVTLYWFLRVFATHSASYKTMEAEFGAPGRIERFLLGAFVLACYLLLAYRGISEYS
jgi:hypothetical protein